MNDMFSRISELLDQPDSAAKIKEMAEAFGSSPESSATENKQADAPLQGMLGGTDAREIALLSAMKPYMRESRATKIDAAIRAIKMIRMLGNLKGMK